MEQVNLLPWRQINQQHDRKNYQRCLLGLSIGVLSIVLISAQWLKQLLHQQQQRWQSAQQHYQQQSSANASQQDCHLSRTNHPEHRMVELFNSLPSLIPPGIYLQQLTWQPSHITLQGDTLSYLLLAQLIATLQQQLLIPKVALLQAHINPDNDQSPAALIQFQLQGYWSEES